MAISAVTLGKLVFGSMVLFLMSVRLRFSNETVMIKVNAMHVPMIKTTFQNRRRFGQPCGARMAAHSVSNGLSHGADELPILFHAPIFYQ
jgi:hypothetical protein